MSKVQAMSYAPSVRVAIPPVKISSPDERISTLINGGINDGEVAKLLSGQSYALNYFYDYLLGAGSSGKGKRVPVLPPGTLASGTSYRVILEIPISFISSGGKDYYVLSLHATQSLEGEDMVDLSLPIELSIQKKGRPLSQEAEQYRDMSPADIQAALSHDFVLLDNTTGKITKSSNFSEEKFFGFSIVKVVFDPSKCKYDPPLTMSALVAELKEKPGYTILEVK